MCTEEQIREKAINIFNNINVEDATTYELTNLQEFDEEIWRAEFCKKYDGKICKGESVKFSFAPESNEVVTMSINRIKYANNETLITETEATAIAQGYLDESSANQMTMTKEIVRPNYFYRELVGDENLYTNINQSRNAYIFTFNNIAESQIYIDCTTGEVIGGNMILGG